MSGVRASIVSVTVNDASLLAAEFRPAHPFRYGEGTHPAVAVITADFLRLTMTLDVAEAVIELLQASLREAADAGEVQP